MVVGIRTEAVESFKATAAVFAIAENPETLDDRLRGDPAFPFDPTEIAVLEDKSILTLP
jgi:hypothetical protein